MAAEEAGVSIQFDEGDAQELPYGDESFDVVASAFGVIFAPDQERAAGQLQRVLRHGGRLGLTAWPLDDWFRLNQRLRPDYEGVIAPRWAEEDHARSLLPEVDLAFDRAEWVIEAGSFDAIWDLLAASVPPLKAWLDTLDADQRAAAKQEYRPLLGDGVMRREYVRILGTRR